LLHSRNPIALVKSGGRHRPWSDLAASTDSVEGDLKHWRQDGGLGCGSRGSEGITRYL